jgi:hypothetical protein
VKSRYHAALLCYAALALAAGFQFTGKIRLALWIFLGALAAKTWIHHQRSSR